VTLDPDELKRIRDGVFTATHYINLGRIRERRLVAELADLRRSLRKMSRLRCVLRKGIKAHGHE
jgi:hypothetical protein